MKYWPGHEVSHDFTVENNTIESNRIGFNGYTPDSLSESPCYGFQLLGNVVQDNRVGIRFSHVRDCLIEGNRFSGNLEDDVKLIQSTDIINNDS